jgi:hypothetical protein
MFVKTKLITTNRNGSCNARHCQNKTVLKGERVIWTLGTYRQKLISAVWHPKCHKEATTFAPCWAQLLMIQQNKAAMPQQYYNHRTGLPLRISPEDKE